jgi:hypothetical protein
MDFHGEGRFRRLNLEEGAEIAFDKVNLSQATFLDTDVEGFVFRDVRWFHPESLLKRWFRDSLVSYIRGKRGAPAELPTLHEGEDIRDRQHWFIKRYIRQLGAEFGKDNRSEAADAKTAGQPEEKSQSAGEQTQSGDTPKAGGETTPPVKAKIRLTIRDRALYRFRGMVLKWTGPTHSSGDGLGRAHALWDEFYNVLDVSEKDDEKLAENYRQLVLNYEKKRDYDVAEDFHFGEMHMRRKGKEASRRRWMPSRWVNGHSIYWLSSGYGTSYRRALLIFAILFLLVSAGFQYSGFQLVEPKSGAVVRTVEYEVLPKAGHQTVSFRKWLADYGQALMYTLSLITFQKGDVYRPLGDVSRLWLAVGTATLAGQAALFFLAIRRRFKR